MTKRIAIIGTGISGLTSAYLLNKENDIKVYEANDYIGGHTATKNVVVNNTHYAIDTGFIVYNEWTYPNFIKLMQTLKVETQATEMSFSVKNLKTKMEYNGNTLNSLFAQRRNILRPSFWRLVLDIVKFNKLCKAHIAENRETDNITLQAFIAEHGLSEIFTQNYILPMCAAIWSTSLEASANFPLSFFLKFFNNHGLLNITNRPQWFTIIGGSNQYVGPLTESFKPKISLNDAVKSVVKAETGVVIVSQKGEETFDEVIFACHSDQALQMLSAQVQENINLTAYSDVLAAIPYSMNEVVLHTDTSVLPARPLAWASWNYQIEGAKTEVSRPAAVTYNMNILQCLKSDTTFCVTLNNTQAISPDKILGTYHYAHPQFSPQMVKAQERRDEICGKEGIHFCGAYWYNGFHEDGIRSALDVCKRFGVSL
ncbi:MAG: putative NAD/FAD-binding protein [Bermanella sp.]|jgi:predicted NAD/FAD-binding protein|uniref:NAD(P)/FAD-dependent oxidoreductase n=1 Tax=Glaciecola sp. 33A TaxID=2057807 RepID=UPI000C323FD6|nr:FAD-dependent oxidoreductase [Glaciecola sp. 33A]PKI01615.1 FAD-dependent oxidoreductase [Glaciecola sp. 33A]